jgi:hypothetical protein
VQRKIDEVGHSLEQELFVGTEQRGEPTGPHDEPAGGHREDQCRLIGCLVGAAETG